MSASPVNSVAIAAPAGADGKAAPQLQPQLQLQPRQRPEPATWQQTGLPFLFLADLVLKVVFLRGQLHMTELGSHIRISTNIVDGITVFLRAEKLCEIARRGTSNTDADVLYTLTDAGRHRATILMAQNAYTGPAPVTLEDYCLQVEAQSVANMRVGSHDMQRLFAGIEVSPNILGQIGAAMNSRRALYVHGPAGSGKTYLAERLCGLLNGSVLVPHAVLINGEIMQLFDPSVHEPAPAPVGVRSILEKSVRIDGRWVECRRPTVVTGGELTMAMLDLQFDDGTRFYQSPSHLKANNGIFIIDDLGRQRCSAVELMNRWIVPLDRRKDYLSLHTGHKFQVPFDVIVVFSSNLAPGKLADDAFSRRLGYKIYIGEQSPDAYERIFRQECVTQQVPWSADAFDYLIHEKHTAQGRGLMACYPRDLIAQVCDLARYEGTPPELNRRVLDWAWNNYFIGGLPQ